MKIHSLQLVRAVAAWLVVYHHYLQIFYGLEAYSGFGSFFAQKGNFGVDLFFVLSGFVMFLSVRNKECSGIVFFLKRIFRVIPAYWFYTLSMVFCLTIFPQVFNTTDYTLVSLLKSLLFIPHENPVGLGVFPLLTVGWTLNFEVTFYTILALCILLSKRRALLICSIIVGFIPIIFLFFFEELPILRVFSSILLWQFVFGILVGYLTETSIFIALSLKRSWSVFLVLLSGSILLLSGYLGEGFAQNTFAATFIILGFLAINDKIDYTNFMVSFLVKLGDYSFSTYLNHIFIIYIFLYIFGNSMNLLYEIITLLMMTTLIIVLSKMSYSFVENSKWTNTLKYKLLSKLTD